MSSCEFENLLPDYCGGDLGRDKQAFVKDHLDSCDSCKKLVKELERISQRAIRTIQTGSKSQARSHRVHHTSDHRQHDPGTGGAGDLPVACGATARQADLCSVTARADGKYSRASSAQTRPHIYP